MHYGIHLSMVYKWNYCKDKIMESKLHSIKPGSGSKQSTREIQETTSMQDKSTNCLDSSNKDILPLSLTLLKSYKSADLVTEICKVINQTSKICESYKLMRIDNKHGVCFKNPTRGTQEQEAEMIESIDLRMDKLE
jgi:hypothetical protein